MTFGYHSNRSIRCKYHAYINKCIHANNGKQITWFRLNINCIGWWSESKICVDQTILTLFAPSAINWYPVSLLTAAPHGDATQSRNQSNEPPLRDSLLFKSDLMPLYPLPFTGTQRVGVSIDWCITPTSFQIVWCFHKFYTLFYMLDTFYLSSLLPSIMYQWNRSLSIPPGQPPGHLNFWKIFVQIPPLRGRRAVQMPHYRSIWSNALTPGKLFSSFYYAPEVVYVNMV